MTESGRKAGGSAGGITVLLVSTVLVKLIGVIFKIPLSNLLGDLGFGYFSSAYDLFTPFYALAMTGLPVAVAKIISEQLAAERFYNVRQTFAVSRRAFTLIGAVGVLLLLTCSPFLVHLTDRTGKTEYGLFAVLPAFFFFCAMSSYRGYYEGFGNMRPTAVSDVIEALGKLLLGLGFSAVILRVTGNVTYAAAAALLGITFGVMLAFFYLKIHYIRAGDDISAAQLQRSLPAEKKSVTVRRLCRTAVPVVLSVLLISVIASLIDVVTVKWQLSRLSADALANLRVMYASSISDYTAESGTALSNDALPTFLYGIRSKAFTLYNLVPAITSVIGVGAIPALARARAAGEQKSLQNGVNSALRLSAIISFPAGLGMTFLSTRIMMLLYSSTASAQIGGRLLLVYGAAAVFTGMALPVISMLQAVGKQRAALLILLVGAALKIVFNLLLVAAPALNILGAALSTLVCYFTVFFAGLIVLARAVGFMPDFRLFLKPAIAAAVCILCARFLVMIGTSRFVTLLAVLTAALVYPVVLVGIKTFNREDILSLPYGNKLLNFLLNHKFLG